MQKTKRMEGSGLGKMKRMVGSGGVEHVSINIVNRQGERGGATIDKFEFESNNYACEGGG